MMIASMNAQRLTNIQAEARFITDKMVVELGELNAGFRAEHTNQIYTMLQHFRNMGQTGEQSYWDYLPSFQK